MARSALLSINVRQMGSPTSLDVTDNRTRQNFTLQNSSIDIASMRDSLRDCLEQLKIQSDQGQVRNLPRVSRALYELSLWGKKYYSAFFMPSHNNQQTEWREILNLFSNYYVLADRHTDDAEPGIIDVESNLNNTIPLEFFVLPGLGITLTRIRTVNDLLEAMKCFMGFRFIINHIIPHSGRSQGDTLDNQPEFRLKYFRHHGLRKNMVDSELDFFQSNQCFDLEGPWPPSGKSAVSEDDFVRHIFYPNLSLNESKKELLDHAHHLLCHCHTKDPNPNRHCLEFLGLKAQLMRLQAHHADYRVKGHNRGDMPFVFLNACGSADIHPAGMSFPRFFLEDNKNPAFIGTEARVPDVFAPEFSKQFYFHLLTGKRIGHALHLAKLDMIQRGKPLGVLYTLYGNPDLRVKKPVPEKAIEMVAT